MKTLSATTELLGSGHLPFGSLEIRFRRTAVTHRARKAIQGGDCCPRRMSLLRFPWLFPIRNSFELRGLCRRSDFGPRTCGRGITHFVKKNHYSSIPTHPPTNQPTRSRFHRPRRNEQVSVCLMHACERVRVCVPSLACELRGARLGRQQLRVLGKDVLDLVVLGSVDGTSPILTRAGVSVGAWRGRG